MNIREPKLDGLRGSFVLTPELRSSLKIKEDLLTGEVSRWGNVVLLVDDYIAAATGPLSTGSVVHEMLLQNLSKIQAMTCSRKYEEFLQRYSSKMFSYLQCKDVKKRFLNYFEEKYLEKEVEVTKKKAMLQGEITGHILAKKGAQGFGDELDCQFHQQEEEQTQQQKEEQLQQQPRKDINFLFESNASDGLETTETFRSLIFNSVYQYFKGDISLHLIRELNIAREMFNPSALGDYLDVMSYELLSKDMNFDEKNALKLCISRIIPTYGPTTLIFDQFFEKQGEEIKKEYEESTAKEITLPVGMSEKMVLVFDDIISKDGLNKNKTRAVVAEMKSVLLRQETCDKELLQMLDILDIIILDMTRASDHKSEITAYRKAASILDIIFNDTELLMKDGENASAVTKDTRLFNMNLYDDKDDKKNITGRKIDLIMCSTGLELGSSEWKKLDTSTKLIEEQRAKNARVNAAILDNIMDMFIDKNGKDVYVIGMDWLGLVGNTFTVWKFKEVTVIRHCGDLIVPTSLQSVKWFKETLNNLFIFKHHLQNLEAIIEPEKLRLEYQSQLNQLRPDKRQLTPNLEPRIFFTLVNKRCKTKKLIGDEDLT